MKKYTDKDLRAYLLKQMNAKDEEAFEKKLATDISLQKRTNEFRDLVMIAELSHQERTRKMLQDLKAEEKSSRKKWGLWSGLFLLAITISGIWYFTKNTEPGQLPIELDSTQSEEIDENTTRTDQAPHSIPVEQDEELPEGNEESTPPGNRQQQPLEKEQPNTKQKEGEQPVFASLITDAAFSAYDLPSSLDITRGAGEQDTFRLAFAALKDKQPEKAITLLLNYSERNRLEYKVDIYLAHAYFLKKDFDKSVELFKKAISIPDSNDTDTDELDWNLLLALLARDNTESDETEALFEKILAPEGFHNKQLPAQELRKRMSRR